MRRIISRFESKDKRTFSKIKKGDYLYGFESEIDYWYKSFIPKGKYLVKAKVLDIVFQPYDSKGPNIWDKFILTLDFIDPKKEISEHKPCIITKEFQRTGWEQGQTVRLNIGTKSYDFWCSYNDCKKRILYFWKYSIEDIDLQIKELQKKKEKIIQDKPRVLDLKKY